MRLINTNTLELVEFFGDKIPQQYAILSHTWEDEEVSFQDWQDLKIAGKKAGFYKIDKACAQARLHGLDYVWVDTNCIDKTSSADLSEAINSMFSWYRNATVCYAYLADVEPLPPGLARLSKAYIQHFCQSKWFTRGWTLQELLAPTHLTFYARDWSKLASRSTMALTISIRTGIDMAYLNGTASVRRASVAQRMSWLSHRVTTRIEDMAYCMLGIFNINMPLLYGEGAKAFIRLQEEIVKISNDHTIFCWTWIESIPKDWVSLLAPFPQAFRESGKFDRVSSSLGRTSCYTMTNAGLSISLPIVQTWSYYLALLNSYHTERRESEDFYASVPIRGYIDSEANGNNLIMERTSFPPSPVLIPYTWLLGSPSLIVRTRRDAGQISSPHDVGQYQKHFSYGFLLILDNTRHLLDRLLRDSSTVKSKHLGREAQENEVARLMGPNTRALRGVYLMERTRSNIHIETYPPDIFECDRSLIVLKEPKSHTGCLIKLGLTGCMIFLGFAFSPVRGARPAPCCRILNSTLWKSGDLERVLRDEENRMRTQSSRSLHGMDGRHITVLDAIYSPFGLIFPTYLTADSHRINALQKSLSRYDLMH